MQNVNKQFAVSPIFSHVCADDLSLIFHSQLMIHKQEFHCDHSKIFKSQNICSKFIQTNYKNKQTYKPKTRIPQNFEKFLAEFCTS